MSRLKMRINKKTVQYFMNKAIQLFFLDYSMDLPNPQIYRPSYLPG